MVRRAWRAVAMPDRSGLGVTAKVEEPRTGSTQLVAEHTHTRPGVSASLGVSCFADFAHEGGCSHNQRPERLAGVQGVAVSCGRGSQLGQRNTVNRKLQDNRQCAIEQSPRCIEVAASQSPQKVPVAPARRATVGVASVQQSVALRPGESPDHCCCRVVRWRREDRQSDPSMPRPPREGRCTIRHDGRICSTGGKLYSTHLLA